MRYVVWVILEERWTAFWGDLGLAGSLEKVIFDRALAKDR